MKSHPCDNCKEKATCRPKGYCDRWETWPSQVFDAVREGNWAGFDGLWIEAFWPIFMRTTTPTTQPE
jgi:hypothetical protein